MARGRRDRLAPKIQNLRWSGATFSFLAQSAGSTAQVFVTSASTTDTIMRIRGELLANFDATLASGRGIDVAIGAIVMPEGQGTTVVSSPISDEDAPWLFYERFALAYEEYVTDVISAQGAAVFRKTIDVKVMRILRPDRMMQLVVEQATVDGAAALNLRFSARILIGQH